MIVQFWKRDAFSIAVELFVLLVVSHLRNLRATQHIYPSLTHAGAALTNSFSLMYSRRRRLRGIRWRSSLTLAS